MHTSAFHSCRIHHNGGYDGNIYITNEDSTSKAIGKKATIKFTCQKLINLYKKVKDQEKVTIKSIPGESDNEEITILVVDIDNFIICRLIDKIREKFDDDKTSNETIRKIAGILGIK